MAKASSPPTNGVQRRLNLRGIIILVVALVVAAALFIPLNIYRGRATRESALAQVRASEKAGNLDLAIRHVDRFVATYPNDVEGLKLQARLLGTEIQSPDQLKRAIQANDKALRLEPTGPDSQEIRRRLIRLDITLSDEIRRELVALKEKGEQGGELRYRAAETLARQMIENGANDAEAHRLLALALEGSALNGDARALGQAIDEFAQALVLDPRDALAAEHLAWLQADKKKDPAAAARTMDALLKVQPDSIDIRMVRYRFFERSNNTPKALAELQAAAQVAPDNTVILATIAVEAIRRREFAQAKTAIERIPRTPANELRIQTLKGTLELNEHHPDEAIEEWRKGLVAVEGTDLNLTYQLANALIQMGRLPEAQPLVKQFQRLAGERHETMARLLQALYDLKAGNKIPAVVKELNRLSGQGGPELDAEVFLALGRAHEASGDNSQALVAYRRLAALRPTAAEPRRAIARILALQNPADALGEIERALAQNPTDVALLNEVGRLRYRRQMVVPADRRRWDDVNEVIDRALAQDPNDFSAQALRADVLAETGRLPEALAILKRAVDGPAKKTLEVWATYVFALDRLGLLDEALQAIDLASAPECVGDRLALRIAKARVLVELNRGQAAREALTKDRDKLPKSERPELNHALAELCRELGDRSAARDALAEWARQAPRSEAPGLNLISFAQSYDDDEAARLGLEALRALGGEQAPYDLAARALELLRIGQARVNSPELNVVRDPAELKRLDEADKYVAQLAIDAPQLSIVPTLQGLILERRGKLPEAIEAYRRGVKDAEITPSLPRLVELLSRQKQFGEIDALKARYVSRANALGTPNLVRTFDQINAAVNLKLGDDSHAQDAVVALVKEQPENLSLRVSLARLLARQGKVKEGESTLRQLTNLRPAEASAWLALAQYRIEHPELGDIKALIELVRAGYKGAHPELLIARATWATNDIVGAARLYDAAVAQGGSDLTVLRDAAEFYDANSKAKEAERTLRLALKTDPKATWASRTLALVLSARPDRANWDEAWALIKPGSPGSGESPEDRLVRATVLARAADNERRDQAAPALADLARDLPASNPVAIEARVRLAQAYLLANQPGEAAAIIAPIADDVDRPNPAALALSIEASSRSNDLAAARRRFERLEAAEPKSPRTVASRAWIQALGGETDKATATLESGYNEAEDAENGEAVALAFQGLMTRLNLKPGALRLAERIARKWPKHAAILAEMLLNSGKIPEAIKASQIALEAGEVREAIQVATKIAIAKHGDAATLQAIDELTSAALAQAPKAPEVAILVATIRHLQGRFPDEVALYRVALENNPKSFTFLNNMAWTLAEGLQRYPEGLERIDEAIRREGLDPQKPDSSQMLDTRGAILFRLGRAEDAAKDLEEAIKLDQLGNRTPSATAYFHLARAYRTLNKVTDARRCREMARKLNLDPATLDSSDKADYPGVMAD